MIYTYENNELIDQIRMVVLSKVNDEYPDYYCSIGNSTYDNFTCCFYNELIYYGNRFQKSDTSKFIYISYDSAFGYYTYLDNFQDRCGIHSHTYNEPQQAFAFTNVQYGEFGNPSKRHGLIDLTAGYNSSSSAPTSSSDSKDYTPYFISISAILLLIFLYQFLRSIFKRGV